MKEAKRGLLREIFFRLQTESQIPPALLPSFIYIEHEKIKVNVQTLAVHCQNQPVDSLLLLLLIFCCHLGFHIECDLKKASEYFQNLLAQHGHNNSAMVNIGLCYAHGIGVFPNLEKAIKSYRKGSEGGDNYAQFHLAKCYKNGLGVPQDLNQARTLYEKASHRGNAMAQTNLGGLYADAIGVAQNWDKAFDLFTLATQQRLVYAQFNLGICYFEAKHPHAHLANFQMAVELFTLSAKQSYPKAQCCLGICYYAGKGVLKDLKEAIYWWTAASDQENVHAQFFLGNCYRDGIGVSVDIEKARFLYWNAQAQGHSDAATAFSQLENSNNTPVLEQSPTPVLHQHTSISQTQLETTPNSNVNLSFHSLCKVS
jgi:TPR repeat protein